MREMSAEPITSLACQLATLLMVLEAHEMDSVERENLIGLARYVSDDLAVSLLEREKQEVGHA